MNSNFTTIDPNSISTKELHGVLLTAVAPRPIALASTVDENGVVNLSPFSFFNVFSANPPILIFSPARRVKDNTTKHTLENVKATKEVVINIVNFPMVEQMSLSSTEYGKGVDEFKKSGLTPFTSNKIRPPRVLESPVAFECIVDDIIALGNEGGAGNLIISRVINIHINNDYFNDSNQLDTEKLNLVARMGASWYTRVTADSLFEIPKPLINKGIGVDSLPKHAQNSTILTGNNLGRLGNIANLPTSTQIELLKSDKEIVEILAISNESKKIDKLHELAKFYLENNELEKSLCLLFCI